MNCERTFSCSVITSMNHPCFTKHDGHLEHQVKKMKEIIMSKMKDKKWLDELIIIDVLQRSGLDYYFKDEIHAILRSQYATFKSMEEIESIDEFYDIALRFRLLRQEGYDVFPNIIKKFKNVKGKFKKELDKDLRGLLSLFEATHVSMLLDEDHILDDAREFSEQVLKAISMETHPRAHAIEYILKNPLHKSFTSRLLDNNFHSIELFHDLNGSEGWMNELLKLASIDFEMAQTSTRKELFRISLWGKELNSSKKLQFARIRPIKWYMWSLAIMPWPNMTEERIELAKAVSFIYIIDDIFDVHATFDELSLFIETINRWEDGKIDHLPEYMKVCLRALYNFTDDFSHKVYEKHKFDPKYSIMQVWVDLCNSFYLEAKWLKMGKLPNAKEYLKNGITSVGIHLAMTHALFLFDGVNQKSIDEMNGFPSIVSSTALIVRLWNDIGTDQNTHREEDDGSYIDCLKNENKEKWTNESARQYVNEMISDGWKRLNQECLFSSSPFSKDFRTSCLNFARMGILMYNHEVQTHRRHLEKFLSALLNEYANNDVT